MGRDSRSRDILRLDGVGVLVVDDAPDIRDLLVTVLDEYGASVTAVGSVPEALDAIQRELPNVLVSDLAMPGQDGHSLISKVRALPPERGGQTPAAALTGDIGAGARVLLAGFQFHIPKPVDVYQLVGVVALLAPSTSKGGRRPSPPVLQSLLAQPDARVLYLFPTKALAQDQLAELEELAKRLPELRMFTYDGDTPQDARRAVRARANLVLTNPDMLHSGILPHHTKWAVLFQNLRYVVIDELHAYRGVFGSHIANVIRRLKRLCRHYGSAPQFIMASATIANPRELAERVIGHSREEVSEGSASTGDKLFLCYNPPVVNPELGIPAPHLGEAARLATRFLKDKIPTIIFAQSRLATEVLLTAIKSRFADKTGNAGIVRGYRGGYLPTRRRAVEQGLRSGEVLGVVSTNALELGVDIGHLDVAVLAGYPGTIASLWQQAGRAGRRSGGSAAVFVATSAPLDQFMVTHPDYL